MKRNGLLVDVYVTKDGYDCTANGVSSQRKQFVLVDDAIEAPFEVDDNDVYLVIVRRDFSFGTYLHVEPRINGKEIRPNGSVGPMMGGNFVYSCDSRFNQISKYPLPIHDRFEYQSNQY